MSSDMLAEQVNVSPPSPAENVFYCFLGVLVKLLLLKLKTNGKIAFRRPNEAIKTTRWEGAICKASSPAEL